MRSLFVVALSLTGSLCAAQSPCDSLIALNHRLALDLQEQRHELDRLNQRVEAGRYDLEMTRKEAKVLRELMKGYIDTIDSLNQENIGLRKALGR